MCSGPNVAAEYAQSALMWRTVPGAGQPVMSVLGAHTQLLLKPSALQHWLRGTSAPPCVARHTHALLMLANLPVGSSSCKQQSQKGLGILSRTTELAQRQISIFVCGASHHALLMPVNLLIGSSSRTSHKH